MLLTLLAPAAPVTNTALDAIKAGNPTFWSGKNIVLVGDSTTDDVGTNDGYMGPRLSAYTGAGEQLDGATIIDDGWTGSTLRDWLDDNVAYGITHTLAADPDVIILCHNINGVRTGADDAADMQAQLEEAVAAIHAGRPDCVIILWTPNSFLTTGALVTGTTPQAATDALWNGYNNVVNQWPTYVAHLDKQTATYGRTCLSSSALMADQIHPSDAGYDLDEAQIIAALTPDAWPFTADDPFFDDVVLILNGDGLTDAAGRHTVTSTGSGGNAVTASGGFLNFPTVDAGLEITGNLGDFDFGVDGAALVTVDIEIDCPPQTGRTNGQRLIAIASGMEMTLTADPDVDYQSGAPFGGNGGGPLDDGNPHSLTYQFSGDQLTMWVDGVVIDNKYDSVDLTPTGGASLFIGRAIDGWNALGYVGGMRLRITKAARYTHNAAITPPTFPVYDGTGGGAYELDVAPASYAVTAAAITQAVGRAVSFSPATYSISAASGALSAARALSIDPTSYSLSAAAVTLTYTTAVKELSVDPAAYSLTVQPVAMTADRTLNIAPASYSLGAAAQTLSVGRVLDVGAVSYALTASPQTLSVTRALNIAPVSYALSAADVTLDYESVNKLLVVEPAYYEIAAADVAFDVRRVQTGSNQPVSLGDRRAAARAKRKQEQAERQKLEADQRALRDQAVEAERAAEEARVQAEKDAVAAALRQIQERSKVATLPPVAPPAPELPASLAVPEPKKAAEQAPPKAEPTVDPVAAAEAEATAKRRALIQENNRRTMLLAAMLMLEVA